MKNYIIFLFIVFALSCKKSPDIIPDSIRLTKVDMYVNRNNNWKLFNTQEYKYDVQGYLTDVIYKGPETSYDPMVLIVQKTIKIQYDSARYIKKMTLNYSDNSFKVIDYDWSENSISATMTSPSVVGFKYSIDLDKNKFPYRKLLLGVVTSLSLNSQGNVVKRVSDTRNSLWEAIEYDNEKFDPLSTSYELRMLSAIDDDLPLIFASRNWLLKYRFGDRNTNIIREANNDEVILESNKKGYPTIVSVGDNQKTMFTYNE